MPILYYFLFSLICVFRDPYFGLNSLDTRFCSDLMQSNGVAVQTLKQLSLADAKFFRLWLVCNVIFRLSVCDYIRRFSYAK